jgi:magnesium transporter
VRHRDCDTSGVLARRHAGWLDAVTPDEAEQSTLRDAGVPPSFIPHALDVAEQPRLQHEASGATLIVLRVPEDDGPGGTAISLAVVIRSDVLVTIASQPLALLDRFAASCGAITAPGALVPALVHAVAEAFDVRLEEIDRYVERLEQRLKGSLRNEEVLELLECQKALVHLERALAADASLVERLRDDPTLALHDEARRQLDDALIELRQALQMTTISAEILASMMDAFASIISNNLNHAMKLMAALTIMLSIPSMIAGLWGMNVPMPGAHSAWAFGALVSGFLACALVVGVIFRRRGWL